MIEIFGVPYLKKGSGIHIKKKNRGKFTEYCGGEVTNECIQRAKNSKNPKLRKRATFAANARKWKHKEGGEINNKDLNEDLNKDEKPKKKLAIKRQTNSTGIVNKRPIPGLLTNELVAQNTKKKGNNEIKQTKVPKGQSGWTAYLNPKNWGVKDYVADSIDVQTLRSKELRSNYNRMK